MTATVLITRLNESTSASLQRLREYYPNKSDTQLVSIAVNLLSVIEFSKHESPQTLVVLVRSEDILHLPHPHTILG